MTSAPLWWTSGGRIACRVHVPRPPSEAFWSLRWTPISDAERAGFREARGEDPTCDGCVLADQIDAADHELWDGTIEIGGVG